jgi:hypothetical protein
LAEERIRDSMKVEINQELVDKIDDILKHGLRKGKGNPIPGQLCVEAAICLALGEPHSDEPSCVGEKVREPKIALNDCDWSSNEARAIGMRDIAIAQLGSDTLNQDEFERKLVENQNKILLPYLVNKHLEKITDEKEVKQILDWAEEFGYTKEFRSKLKDYNKYNYYYYYYNYYYYYDYNYYCHNYYCHNDYYNYYDYFGDEFLLLIAQTILTTLKEMNSPGCKWLK